MKKTKPTPLFNNENWKIKEAQLIKEVYIDDNCVTFSFAQAQGYFIELKRINTPKKLLKWVLQLAEKSWMTPERLTFFIRLIGNHFGMNLEDGLF